MTKCPRLCGGKINVLRDPTIEAMAQDHRLKEPLTLSATELYQAVLGAGLPDEIPKSWEAVQSFLLARHVVKADVEEINGKIYLSELTLVGGVTLHLTAGPRGAQVLKITKEEPRGSENHR